MIFLLLTNHITLCTYRSIPICYKVNYPDLRKALKSELPCFIDPGYCHTYPAVFPGSPQAYEFGRVPCLLCYHMPQAVSSLKSSCLMFLATFISLSIILADPQFGQPHLRMDRSFNAGFKNYHL